MADRHSKFYVYIHRRPDTGAVFYVGKGSGNRARSGVGRGAHWNSVVLKNKGRFDAEIVAYFDAEDDAYAAEGEWIAALGAEGVSLVNKTRGGRGAPGVVVSERLREATRQRALAMAANPIIQAARRQMMLERHQDPERIANFLAAVRALRCTPDAPQCCAGRKFAKRLRKARLLSGSRLMLKSTAAPRPTVQSTPRWLPSDMKALCARKCARGW
jgi:hypothetical protein